MNRAVNHGAALPRYLAPGQLEGCDQAALSRRVPLKVWRKLRESGANFVLVLFLCSVCPVIREKRLQFALRSSGSSSFPAERRLQREEKGRQQISQGSSPCRWAAWRSVRGAVSKPNLSP